MSYFVTGATGFIGRFLLEKLLARRGTIYVLARKGSKAKIEDLKERYPEHKERIVPIWGDLTKPKLGVSAEQVAEMKGKIKHLFHLAAIYDLSADAASQEAALRSIEVQIKTLATAAAQTFEDATRSAPQWLQKELLKLDGLESGMAAALRDHFENEREAHKRLPWYRRRFSRRHPHSA